MFSDNHYLALTKSAFFLWREIKIESQSNKNHSFRSDFDGTPHGNYIILIATAETLEFSHHSRAIVSYRTLYNPIMRYPRLPRLIPLVGLETGFCAPLPRNFDEL